MRLLGIEILLGMARANGDPGEVQPREKLADGALVHLHAEVPRDLVAQITAPPAHHLVHLPRRPGADPIGNLGFLRRGQLALRPAVVRPVGQPLQALRVIAMNPVPQRLPIHSCRLCRLGPVLAFENQRQRQHPARCRCILGPCRGRPQAARVKVCSCNCYRHI